MKKSVVVLGAGGHARVLLDALMLQRWNILGVTELAPIKAARAKLPVPVLGKDDAILSYSPGKILLVNGLGSIRVDPKRAELFRRFKEKGYQFANVLHPSAVLAKDVELGEGVQIMAGVVIQTGTKIGDNTIINTRASIDHDCTIGSHVHIAPGVVLSGGVSIGNGSHLGTAAVVVQGVSIAANSFIRANSLVCDANKSQE